MNGQSMNGTATVDDIYSCYRLLLGREPDAQGLAAFERLLRERTMSARELASCFLRSEEFARSNDVEPVEVPIGDYVIHIRPNDDAIGRTVLLTRQWEPNVSAAVHERLRQGQSFLDVGANIGYFSALAASIVGPSGKVFAVEPLDRNLQLVYATIDRNGFSNVDVHPFAASDRSELVVIDTGDTSSNAQIVHDRVRSRSSTRVQTRRIDDMIGRAVVDMIKFDVEGHELKAWRGAERVLERNRPVVLSEFHPQCLRQNTGIDPLEYASVLFDYGAVTVLHFDGRRSKCPDSEQLMRSWAEEDASLRTNGAAHLDVLVEPLTRIGVR